MRTFDLLAAAWTLQQFEAISPGCHNDCDRTNVSDSPIDQMALEVVAA